MTQKLYVPKPEIYAGECRRPVRVAFESGKLTYTENPVDLYNSGMNCLLSVAVKKGLEVMHFRAGDVFDCDGRPYVKVSILEDTNPNGEETPDSYKTFVKVDERTIPFSYLDLCIRRGDDISPFTPTNDIMAIAEENTVFLATTDETCATCDKYEMVRRCPDLPMPETYPVNSIKEANEAVNELDGRGKEWFVVKDRYGYGCGATVHRVRFSDPDRSSRLEEYLDRYEHGLIMQEFCPEVCDGDLRAVFFDGEYQGGFMRIPLADWRTNIDGGFCSYKLTDEQVGIARETAISFPECRLTAVDMLPSGKVFEINANAGTLGLPDEDRVVLAKKVLNKLEEELKDKELEVSDKELLAV